MSKLKVTVPGEGIFFVQEAYKFLRTNLQFCGPDIKVIAVTSCYENEGKSTVAISLTKSFAELGKKSLLVDADMRKSVLAGRNLMSKDFRGLSEILSGMVTADELIHETNVENMSVLLAGNYPPNPAELLANKNFGELIAGCRERYDYVIIDTPPLGVVSDAAVIAPSCDGTVLVVGNNKINSGVALDVVESLRKSGTPLLGAIRNNCHSASSKNGYYGSKYYGKSKYNKDSKYAKQD